MKFRGSALAYIFHFLHACLQVMEYVQERASLYELTKAVKAWERKVEISEVSHMTRHLENTMTVYNRYNIISVVSIRHAHYDSISLLIYISEVSTRHSHYDSMIVSLSDFAIACYNG